MDAPTPRHRAPTGRLLLLAAVATALGCASAAPPSTVEELEGCYFFRQDDAARALRLPDGIHLTPRPLEGWPAIMQRGAVKVAVTLSERGPVGYPFGYWLLEDDGSVEVGYPAGGGIVLDLMPGREELQGIARTYGDAIAYGEEPETQEVPVRLERRRCPES